MPVFKLTLHPTYYNKGFFNITANLDRFIGPEGRVTLKLGINGSEIHATIDRSSQNNGTARIRGGVALRNWFQEKFAPMDTISVDLSSRETIVLDSQADKGEPLQPLSKVFAVKINSRVDPDKPFQRKGAKSNTDVGREFQASIQDFFSAQGLYLTPSVPVQIGISGKKSHAFDLGNTFDKVLVECKAHTWTEGDNVPSAKLTVWNEAMFFFYTAPAGFRKLLVVQKDFSVKRNETLGEYYVRTYSHLIPNDVEVWEYDQSRKDCRKIN